MLIEIGEIKIAPGRREADPKHAADLAKSISEIGLINPITIDQGHTLIAGLHRLEAFKLLGRTEIECTVSNLDGLQAELAEIDENFVRTELSAVEYSDLLLRRKEIYEALHPETKAGVSQAAGMNRAVGNNVECKMRATSKPFVDDTAEKLGVHPSTVRRQIQTAKNLTPEAKKIIRDSDAKLTKTDALQLSRLSPEKQKEAASMLASGEINSMRRYPGIPESSEASPGLLSESLQDGESPEASEPSEDKKEAAIPHAAPAACPPPQIRGTPLFREIVADLKNTDKDFSCTPDSFLAEIASFVQNFQKELDWYNMPYYEAVYPALTPEQFRKFRRQMDAICAAVQNLIHHVEANVK